MHQHEQTKHQEQYDAAGDKKNRGLRTINRKPHTCHSSLAGKTPVAVFQEFRSSTPTGAMTSTRSPVAITLSIEHHEELSLVKRYFMDLFGAGPRKVTSPLPETPQKVPSASGCARNIFLKNGIAPIFTIPNIFRGGQNPLNQREPGRPTITREPLSQMDSGE